MLIMRGVPIERLAGLRKRIATCLFLYCKNPVFNPEAGRLLMVCLYFADFVYTQQWCIMRSTSITKVIFKLNGVFCCN